MPKSAEITPRFNPTDAPNHEVHPKDFRLDPSEDFGFKPYSDFHPESDGVDIYRLEQRERVVNGLGITASRIVQVGTLHDSGGLHPADHMFTHPDIRSKPDKSTPYVSFATDPDFIVRKLILGLGWGLKDGSDSVVVKARVQPDRILAPGGGKQSEVLLVGGVSPEEYERTYEIDDFVRNHIDPTESVVTAKVGEVKPEEAIKRWRLQAKTSSQADKR
ncbi:MAG TPA: hypothetical protein VK497_02900 [Candidatus Saccharimonadales bacterium]|nr:hypothetical protein [Candidatus Saccharimonadales bacterium]